MSFVLFRASKDQVGHYVCIVTLTHSQTRKFCMEGKGGSFFSHEKEHGKKGSKAIPPSLPYLTVFCCCKQFLSQPGSLPVPELKMKLKAHCFPFVYSTVTLFVLPWSLDVLYLHILKTDPKSLCCCFWQFKQ